MKYPHVESCYIPPPDGTVISFKPRDPVTTAAPMMDMPCCGLIDQGRFIGSDPVGYRCTCPVARKAVVGGVAYYLCDGCATLLAARLPRLTLPAHPLTPEQWREQAGSVLKRWLGRDKT